MSTSYVRTSEPTTQPSTAITTPAQRYPSSFLDRIEIERQNSGQLSTLQRLSKMALEAAFVPAFGREVRHG